MHVSNYTIIEMPFQASENNVLLSIFKVYVIWANTLVLVIFHSSFLLNKVEWLAHGLAHSYVNISVRVHCNLRIKTVLSQIRAFTL